MKDYFGFKDKTIVITGASSGMGEAAARMLIDLDAEVHAVGNKKQLPFDNAVKHYADLSNKEQMDELIEKLPAHIDALFICQGMAQSPSNALQVQKVNFLSVRYLAEALAPRIADNGSVTVISSAGGYGWQDFYAMCKEVIDCASYEKTIDWYIQHEDYIEKSPYQFSKQCLNAYVESKVFDPLYIDRKIRLNAICPGNTITGLTEEFNKSASATGDAADGQQVIESIFLDPWDGRWAEAHEMGYPLVAIGSQLFSYMSGQVIYFDYGLSSMWEIDELEA